MRLTKDMRQNIIDSIVAKAVNKKQDALIEEYRLILQQIADSKYPKEVKDWMDKAPKSIRNEAFNTTSSASLYYSDGSSVPVPFITNNHRGCSLKTPIKVLASDANSYKFIATKKLDSKIKVVVKKMNQLVEKRDHTRSTIRQAVYSCNTRKQLIELYPDLEEFVPASSGLSNLPMVQASAVKKIVSEAKRSA